MNKVLILNVKTGGTRSCHCGSQGYRTNCLVCDPEAVVDSELGQFGKKAFT